MNDKPLLPAAAGPAMPSAGRPRRRWGSGLAARFAALAGLGVLLFGLPFAFYVHQSWQALQGLQREAAAIAPARALLRVVQLTQQHRGLFNGGLLEQRAGKQAEADRSYREVGALLAASGSQAVAQAWPPLAAEWSALTGAIAAGRIDRADSLARHTALIARELDLAVLLGETQGLAFDADPQAHHLVRAALTELPQLTEVLGRARALGAAYLAGRQLDAGQQTAIAALVQTARLVRANAGASLAKAAAAAGGDRAASPRMALAAADGALALIERETLQPVAPTLAPAAFFQAMTDSIDAQFAAQEQASELLQTRFEERMQARRTRLVEVLAGLLVAAAVVIAFGIAIARSIAGRIRHSVALARRVAEGDLTVRLHADGRDEIAQLQQELAQMVARLHTLVHDVAAGAGTVSHTSAQIAQGNLDLSQRTEEQASTLEETASSLEQLTATVAQTADHARVASGLAAGAAQVARSGAQIVGDVIATMSEIADASTRIGEITSLIDAIAFQTNILALNAAVEAARAGGHGRGFAVVAAEVRTLAQRCAAAAREIKGLIGASSQKVEAGTRLVGTAGATMSELQEAIGQVTRLMAEIAAATGEQSTGIGQVNAAVMQMDQVVQQNAALVEQAAAATQSLKEEAALLLQGVARFRLTEAHAAPPPPAPAGPWMRGALA